MISLWAIQLTGKKVFDQLAAMAAKHPTRTIGEITKNIKDRKFNLGGKDV